MKFDIIDAMSIMNAHFGSRGEIITRQDKDFMYFRLSVFINGEFFHKEFTVSRLHLLDDSKVPLLNLQFRRSVHYLKRYILEETNEN